MGRERLLDAMPSLVLCPLALVEVVERSENVHGPHWAVALLLGPVGLALWWRRRQPLVVLAVVLLLIGVPAAAWGMSELNSPVYGLIIAVYACGRYGTRPWAYGAIPLASAGIVLIGASDPNETVSSTWVWSLNSIWVFGIGAWLRQKSALQEAERRQVAAEAVAAIAEERSRIARDLHDVLAHSLSVMVVQAGAAEELLDSRPEVARNALANVQTTGRDALRDVRGLLSSLRQQPGAEGPRQGLSGLVELAEQVRAAGLPVTLATDGDLTSVPPYQAEVAFRVVQEALTNTLRHVGPVPVDVHVEVAAGRVRVHVCDEGPAAQPATAGNGLSSMRERVEAVGGSLVTRPREGAGFEVLAVLPMGATA